MREKDCENCYYCGLLFVDRPCEKCINDVNRPFKVEVEVEVAR